MTTASRGRRTNAGPKPKRKRTLPPRSCVASVTRDTKRAPAAPPPAKLTWVSLTQFFLTVERDDVRFACAVSPGLDGTWSALALETAEKDIVNILDNHAHEFLGTFPSLPQALLVAEDRARAWLFGLGKPSEPCECKTILPPKGEPTNNHTAEIVGGVVRNIESASMRLDPERLERVRNGGTR